MTKSIEYSLLSLTTISKKKKKYICDDYVQSIILTTPCFVFDKVLIKVLCVFIMATDN
jgi:hypothetical protein